MGKGNPKVKSKVVVKQNTDLRDHLNSRHRNKNQNHCAEAPMETVNTTQPTRKRTRSSSNKSESRAKMTEAESRTYAKTRRSDRSTRSSKSDEELDYKDDVYVSGQEMTETAVRFEEDNDIVDLTVNDHSNFTEEDDRDSEFSDQEEGELMDTRPNSDAEKSADEADEVVPLISTHKKNNERLSVEDQLSKVNSTLEFMQEMMIKKGMFDEFEDSMAKQREKGARPKKRASGGKELNACELNSDTTIYKVAVEEQVKVNAKLSDNDQTDPEISFKINDVSRRESTSSEDFAIYALTNYYSNHILFKPDFKSNIP